MEFFKELIFGVPESFSGGVAHSVIVLSLVIAAGYILAKIKIKGISLGITWILFAGIFLGHFGITLDSRLLSFIKEFGLILFVYSIGIQVGPGFFSAFRAGGLKLNLIAAGSIAVSVITTIVIHLITKLPISTMVGILYGAVTNTPGLGAAQQTYTDITGTNAPEIAMGYAVAYPLGVVGAILTLLLLRYLTRINPKEEEEAVKNTHVYTKGLKPGVGPVVKTPKPLVVLPVFPGTNCEYDMARAFRIAGAETKTVIIRNRSQADISESLKEFSSLLEKAQILALSGGFSAGDEPDGSGKFIANILREERIAELIMNLLENKKGLVLGICNGFQALIKTGLLPYGKIKLPTDNSPTLTFNTIGRHISRVVSTKVVSNNSPWATGLTLGGIYQVPVSHGEGRIVLNREEGLALFENGQVFTQYTDLEGNPTMEEPWNPNGSKFAIEGLTSPDGLVLGKMGHSERTIPVGKEDSLLINIPGNKNQNLFQGGVNYFR